MAQRLTDTIAGLVTSEQLERLGTTLGATPNSTTKVVHGSVAALLTGLAGLAGPAGGTRRVSALLDRGGITGVDGFDEMLEQGEDVDGAALAGEILAAQTDSVVASLSREAGVSSDGARRALGLVAPLVVSSLVRRQRDQSLSAASVGAILIAERDALAASAASAGVVTAASQAPAAAEAQLAAKALEVTRDEAARHEGEERRRRRYVWPFVALFAIVGVVLAIVLALTLGDDAPAEPAPPPEPAAAQPAPAEPPAPAPEGPEPELPTDILLIAETDGSYGTLLAALEQAGLDSMLRGEGPITLLAPTDAAFADLPPGTFEAIASDPERLNELLSAHIIEGTHLKAALAERDEVTTQDGRRLPIVTDGSDVAIAGAGIVAADLEARNGVLQGLDALIIPEGFELTPPLPITVVDRAADSGQHAVLLGALLAANLIDTLRSTGPFTLFAPTDDAFAALPDGALEEILADPAALEQLITAHVSGGVHDLEELSSRPDLTMLTGQVIPISADGSGLVIGGSRVTESDIQADNGILHVVDAVILPEGLALGADATAIDTLDAAGTFTTLLDSLDAADLADTLRGPGPLTIFAFTDEAFLALPESARSRLADDPSVLAILLDAHYASGSAEATTIADAETFAVASGEQIAVVTDGELIWIGGSRIVESIDSGNAVIHVVDRVIIPPSFSAKEGTVNELLALAPVRFEVASADLTPSGRRVLSRAVAYLRTNPVNVEIGGHTDSDGEDDENQTLSGERAAAVFDFLINSGVDSALLTTAGYGATQPIASNDTERGKARNRRIEFTILS